MTERNVPIVVVSVPMNASDVIPLARRLLRLVGVLVLVALHVARLIG